MSRELREHDDTVTKRNGEQIKVVEGRDDSEGLQSNVVRFSAFCVNKRVWIGGITKGEKHVNINETSEGSVGVS